MTRKSKSIITFVVIVFLGVDLYTFFARTPQGTGTGVSSQSDTGITDKAVLPSVKLSQIEQREKTRTSLASNPSLQEDEEKYELADQASSGPPMILESTDMALLAANDPYLQSLLGEHKSFSELESDQLILLIKSPDASDELRHQAIQALISWSAQEGVDQTKAFQSLVEVKDVVNQEDQQYLLKEMRRFTGMGGNDALVDSFVRAGEQGESVNNRARILSYLDPTVPLTPKTVGQLTSLYDTAPKQEMRGAMVNALAQTGGETGVVWLIDRVVRSTDYGEWSLIVESLGQSNSSLALEHLHQALNAAVPLGPQYEENRERLRQAILRMNEMAKPASSNL